jgi:PPM family protein phosphatase
VEIFIAGGTDIGRKRGHNEDSYGIFPEHGLAVVADGMGGHAAGDVASRIAVDALSGFVTSVAGREDITWPFRLDESLSRAANTLVIGAKLANKAVMERAADSPELRGMGTTLVAALADGDNLHIIHVGDSRAYMLSGGAFSRLTVDHSFVEEQVQAGIITPERARTHPMRNIVTRALGIKGEVEVDLTTRTPSSGDIFLLCTDGLSGMLDDSATGRIIIDNLSDLDLCVNKLIDAANERGGDDNITVVLIKVA